MADEITQTKIDVGILKEQINNLSVLVQKLEGVVDKLNTTHEVQLTKFENELTTYKADTQIDIRAIYTRINDVVSDLRATERRLSHDIDMCRTSHDSNVTKIQDTVDKWEKYKWVIIGGVVVAVLLIKSPIAVQILNLFK